MTQQKTNDVNQLSDDAKRVADDIINEAVTSPTTTRLRVRRRAEDQKSSDAFVQDRLRDLDDKLK